MTCCEKCQFYWSREAKWYSGERGVESVCCNRCDFYKECLQKEKSEKKQTKNN